MNVRKDESDPSEKKDTKPKASPDDMYSNDLRVIKELQYGSSVRATVKSNLPSFRRDDKLMSMCYEQLPLVGQRETFSYHRLTNTSTKEQFDGFKGFGYYWLPEWLEDLKAI